MKLKTIRWFKTKDAIGLGVGIFSCWFGFGIDANAPLRPLIHDIKVARMTGLDFNVVFRHKVVVKVRKWIKQPNKEKEE